MRGTVDGKQFFRFFPKMSNEYENMQRVVVMQLHVELAKPTINRHSSTINSNLQYGASNRTQLSTFCLAATERPASDVGGSSRLPAAAPATRA